MVKLHVAASRKIIFGDNVKNTFLTEVKRTGLVATAARNAGTNSRRIKTECEQDKEFEADLKECLMIYAETIQAELHKRAVEGVEEDVYFQGQVCGQKINYSDALLTTLVKAKSPEFREKLSVDTTIHGGVMLTIPQAQTTREWLTEANPAQLPAPEESEADPAKMDIIDVESE